MTERNTAKPEDYGGNESAKIYAALLSGESTQSEPDPDLGDKRKWVRRTGKATIGDREIAVHITGRPVKHQDGSEKIMVAERNPQPGVNRIERQVDLDDLVLDPREEEQETGDTWIRTGQKAIENRNGHKYEVTIVGEPEENDGVNWVKVTPGHSEHEAVDPDSTSYYYTRASDLTFSMPTDIDAPVYGGRRTNSIHEKQHQEYITELMKQGRIDEAIAAQEVARIAHPDPEMNNNISIDQGNDRHDVDPALQEAADRLIEAGQSDAAEALLRQNRTSSIESQRQAFVAERHEAQDVLAQATMTAFERRKVSDSVSELINKSIDYLSSEGDSNKTILDARDIASREVIDEARSTIRLALRRKDVPAYVEEVHTTGKDRLVDIYYQCDIDPSGRLIYIERRDEATGRVVDIKTVVTKDNALERTGRPTDRTNRLIWDITDDMLHNPEAFGHIVDMEALDRESIYKLDGMPSSVDLVVGGLLTEVGISKKDMPVIMNQIRMDKLGYVDQIKTVISRRRRAHSADGPVDGGPPGEPDDASEPLSSGEPSAEGVVEPATETGAESTDTDAEPPVETNGKPPRRRLRDRLWRKPKPADTPPINLQVSPAQERLMAEQDGQVSPSEPVAPAEDSVEASIEPPTDDSGDIPTGTFHSADAEPSGETPMAPTEPSSTDLDVETSSETREAIWHLGDGVGDRRVKIRNELINTGTGQYYQILADIDGNEINTIVPADQIELQGSR